MMEIFGWDGLVRRDGVEVVQEPGGDWVVMPRDGREVLTLCPCCSRSMVSERAAKLVANIVYPLAKA